VAYSGPCRWARSSPFEDAFDVRLFGGSPSWPVPFFSFCSSAGAYGEERPDTAIVLAEPPGDLTDIQGLMVRDRFSDGSVLITVRRYAAFKEAATMLAQKGARFAEIAGNRGPILITALAPTSSLPVGGTLVFRQPILTRPGVERIAVSVQVAQLHTRLRNLPGSPMCLEHIYDY
jgi:hypothetical protein